MTNKAISDFLKDLGTMAGFKEPDKEIAHTKGICVRCGEPAISRCHTVLDFKEYGISGLCGICWNEINKEPEE